MRAFRWLIFCVRFSVFVSEEIPTGIQTKTKLIGDAIVYRMQSHIGCEPYQSCSAGLECQQCRHKCAGGVVFSLALRMAAPDVCACVKRRCAHTAVLNEHLPCLQALRQTFETDIPWMHCKRRPHQSELLRIAIMCGQLECTKWLLSLDATDINALPWMGNTVVVTAAMNDSTDYLKLLLAHPSLDMSKHKDALMRAAQKNRADCMTMLLDTPGTFVPPRLLTEMIRKDKKEAALALIASPAVDVNHLAPYMDSPMIAATKLGNHVYVTALLSREDLDVNQVPAAIVHATFHHRITVLRILLDIPGVNMDGRSTVGPPYYQDTTALVVAVREHKADCVKLLLEHPHAGIFGSGPLAVQHAIQKNAHECFDMLIASRHVVVREAELIFAVRCRRIYYIDRLISSFPALDVNVPDGEGHTALIIAAQLGDFASVDCLLRVSGLDINRTCKDGYSALDHAVRCGNTPCASMIIKAVQAGKYAIPEDAIIRAFAHATRSDDDSAILLVPLLPTAELMNFGLPLFDGVSKRANVFRYVQGELLERTRGARA